MIIPELPAYLTSLGGAAYKGLIIALFTITAMISRPFSGRLADKVGRVPIVMFGSIVCLICSLVYPIISSVAGFLMLRLVHGFSTGFTPTGQSAYLSDIIPVDRRGEAMGILGTSSSIGMAGGPALGGFISSWYGLDAMFYCSSCMALISVIILLRMKETLSHKQAFNIQFLKLKKEDLFEPRVWAPCLVMVLAAYAYGAAFTLMPDFGAHLHIQNKGLLFACLTIASLVVRLLGGKASDIWGRKPVLRVSVSVIAIAMMIIALAETSLQLIIGVTLYGLGQGTTSPTLLAWATDLSNPEHRGRGIASLYIFMELGIGLGAFASGWLYGNEPAHFFLSFAVCSALASLALIYLFIHRAASIPVVS